MLTSGTNILGHAFGIKSVRLKVVFFINSNNSSLKKKKNSHFLPNDRSNQHLPYQRLLKPTQCGPPEQSSFFNSLSFNRVFLADKNPKIFNYSSPIDTYTVEAKYSNAHREVKTTASTSQVGPKCLTTP